MSLGLKDYARYEGMDEIMKASRSAHSPLRKATTKPFRKMGHVTIVDNDLERLKMKANFCEANTLKVIA